MEAHPEIKRLAENEGEWQTDVVLQVGSKYVLRHENGGSRGSHQRNNRFPALLSEDESLTAEEAALKCSEFGADESVIDGIGGEV